MQQSRKPSALNIFKQVFGYVDLKSENPGIQGPPRWKLLWEVSWPYPVAVTWCSAAFPEPSRAQSWCSSGGILCFLWLVLVQTALPLLSCSYHSPDNTLQFHIQFKNKEKKKTCSSSGWFVWLPGFGLCFASVWLFHVLFKFKFKPHLWVKNSYLPHWMALS